ncbi:DUF4365 domain-containing protein [Sphingobium yanoikuyae]|jgi:hypothetical protein|uniref:DUF4365 domain-containing protein n=1 Tax=Sphingobium yanoikuyae TaxID=13690 RepID=UPI0028A81208|nr:DUF4365 domain-containing protein [Sphingobium yanoikuyae]
MRSTDETNRIGISAISLMFSKLRWAFREQPTSDFGIDAHVEKLADDGMGLGKLIALQIKTGQSYFKKRGDGYVYYGEDRHRRYWTTHSLPVFIILHDPDSGLTLWQRVEEHLIEEQKNGRWSIQIPENQTLDAENEIYFEKGIAADEASVRRYRLALDLELIKRFEGEEHIFLRVEDWVNKTLNYRTTQVIFNDDPDAGSDLQLNTWLPAHTIGRFMAVLFPWLDWSLHEHIGEENGAYEVAVHVLEVELNAIGKAVLSLENYYVADLPNDEPPQMELDKEWLDYLAEMDKADRLILESEDTTAPIDSVSGVSHQP